MMKTEAVKWMGFCFLCLVAFHLFRKTYKQLNREEKCELFLKVTDPFSESNPYGGLTLAGLKQELGRHSWFCKKGGLCCNASTPVFVTVR